jgi:hypothetical protein
LARWLAVRAGFVHVDVSDHYPTGDQTAEERRVMFELLTPIGVVRVVPKNRLYTQRLWLLGKDGRVAIEGLQRGAVDSALVMMSARTYAAFAEAWADTHPTDLVVWKQRHEGE